MPLSLASTVGKQAYDAEMPVSSSTVGKQANDAEMPVSLANLLFHNSTEQPVQGSP